MQEEFSKIADPNVPLQEQECFELRLDDLGKPFRPQFVDILGAVVKHRFIVFQAHAAWSEIDGQIMWDAARDSFIPTLELQCLSNSQSEVYATASRDSSPAPSPFCGQVTVTSHGEVIHSEQ